MPAHGGLSVLPQAFRGLWRIEEEAQVLKWAEIFRQSTGRAKRGIRPLRGTCPFGCHDWRWRLAGRPRVFASPCRRCRRRVSILKCGCPRKRTAGRPQGAKKISRPAGLRAAGRLTSNKMKLNKLSAFPEFLKWPVSPRHASLVWFLLYNRVGRLTEWI
jgi:hypothetical protein